MATTKKTKTRHESNAELDRKIRDLDWDEDTEISVVINNPAKLPEDPTTLVQAGWRLFKSIPSTPKKVIAAVLLAVLAAVSRNAGIW